MYQPKLGTIVYCKYPINESPCTFVNSYQEFGFLTYFTTPYLKHKIAHFCTTDPAVARVPGENKVVPPTN
jgi:hypothetical protein